MDEKIVIEKYSLAWALDFEHEKIKIGNVLGEKLVQIEHIGSTSIVDLGAKPIIDIMVGVHNLDEVVNFIDSFKEIGYEFVWHNEFPERRFFRRGQRRAGTHHLHIYRFGSEHWKNNILFRDYLRQNSNKQKEYQNLKNELAEKYPND